MHDSLTYLDLSKMIDHSLLHPTMSDQDIIEGCYLAAKYEVATVCVKPYSVNQAKKILGSSNIGVCSVIGFPHGNSKTRLKILETEEALRDGAVEIDMVINIGKAISGEWNYVSREIEEINETTTSSGTLLKVIFETDFLNDDQIIELCQICSSLKVAFVKTSTGYGFVRQPNGYYAYQGATEHNLKLMRDFCSLDIQVKAAGGIRSLDDLLQVRKWGVSRVGATATEKILEEAIHRGYQK